MAEFIFLSEKNRQRYLRMIAPLARFFARVGVHPNVLSFFGLLLSVLAGLIYSSGSFFWAAWVVVLAGSCDALDGQLARQTGKDSRFGAFFDSTLDRFGEVFIFMGLAWFFSGGTSFPAVSGGKFLDHRSPWAVIFIVLAICGSFMVSYTRARAEGLGIHCKVGWMQRPERITLLVIGSLLSSLPAIGLFLMKVTLFLLAVLSNFTALQRVMYVKSHLSGESRIL